MNLRFSAEDERFRTEVRAWLEEHLSGEFAELRGTGGPGDEDSALEGRLAWERHLGAAGWTCVGWPRAHGGRGASLTEQVIYHEEYARARAPGRVGHIGETLLGPTLIAFGTPAQKQRFLDPIRLGQEFWCQGYSEPEAGSDLANVQTRAVLDGDEWVITGQKVWTSHAQWSDWCFALCRTHPDAARHRGLSYLLLPMEQPGVEVRPIQQLTGTCEFNEVFFDEARTAQENVLGEVDGGWQVAMATLGFERGVSTLGQQFGFRNELEAIIELARSNGKAQDPVFRQRIADAWIGLRVMRLNALRTLSAQGDGRLSPAAMINKLFWATWHQRLGELAMDVVGPEAACCDEGLSPLQRLFLFSRADTIYAGSNQIQRNIIGERALGLPREPRP